MKYGKALADLIIEKWKDVYIDYKALKKALKAGPSGIDSVGYVRLLQEGIDRVNAFVIEQEHFISSERDRIESLRQTIASADHSARLALTARTRQLWTLVDEVNSVVETCYTTCYKALKKHDKTCGDRGPRLQQAVLAAVERQPFMLWRLDGSLVAPTTEQTRAPLLLDAARAAGIGDAIHGESGDVEAPAGSTNDVTQALTAIAGTISSAAIEASDISVDAADSGLCDDGSVDSELARFDAVVRGTAAYAAQALQDISPELALDAQGRATRLQELALPLAALRQGLLAAAAGVPPGAEVRAAGRAACTGAFRAVAGLITREVEQTFPEGAAPLEHLLRLHALCSSTAEPRRRRTNRPAALAAAVMQSARALVASPLLIGASAPQVLLPHEGSSDDLSPDSGGEAFADKAADAAREGWRGRCMWLMGLDEPGGPAESDGGRGSSLLWRLWLRWRPACVEWLPVYKLRKYLPGDVAAGVTIGVMLMPQGLAYAGLAGLPAHYGIYTGFPAAIYAVFGTSRQGAIGPQSIPALLIASGLGAVPSLQGAQYLGAVMATTALVGAMMLAIGWLQLGFIARFISRPVLSGFAAGSAILTIASSLKGALGVQIPTQQTLWQYAAPLASTLPGTNWPTVVTAAVAIALLVVLPKARWSRVVPAPLQVTVLAVAFFWAWMAATGVSGVVDVPAPSASAPNATAAVYAGPGSIGLVGTIPSGLPQLAWPVVPTDTGALAAIASTAITVVFVGFIESMSVAQKYAVAHGYDVSATSELKALGAANLVGSTLGSIPVMAAFGRSSVNDGAGARSPLAQVVSAFTVLLFLLLAARALFYLPQAVLSAIIFVSVSGLVDVAGARRLWAVDRVDCVCLLVSFAATIGLGVSIGVAVAIGVSLAFFVGRAIQPPVDELGRVAGSIAYRPLGELGVTRVPRLKLVRFGAPLWFANCAVLREALLGQLVARRRAPPLLRWAALVLDCAAVTGADSSSLQALEDVVAEAHAHGALVLLAGANAAVEGALRRSGLLGRLGGPRMLPRTVHEAVQAVAAGAVSIADVRLQPVASAVAGGAPPESPREGEEGAASSPTLPAPATPAAASRAVAVSAPAATAAAPASADFIRGILEEEARKAVAREAVRTSGAHAAV